MIRDVVAGIVTGLANSGTTFTFDVLSAHPAIDRGGMETGIFLTAKPERFDGNAVPIANQRVFRRQWSMGMSALNGSPSYEAAWRKLKEKSGLNGTSRLVDKCPAYLWMLPEVIERSQGLPVAVMRRDPRGWCFSKVRRRTVIEWVVDRYQKAHGEVCPQMEREHGDLVRVFQFEDFVLEPVKTARRLYAHLGLDFEVRYVEGLLRKFDKERCVGEIEGLGPRHAAIIKENLSDFFLPDSMLRKMRAV